MPITHRRALEILSQAQVFSPAIIPKYGGGGFYVYSAMKIVGSGETIEEALTDARAKGNIPDLAPRPQFKSDGLEVLLRGQVVATVKSRTYADRIANALNSYNPNERGR